MSRRTALQALLLLCALLGTLSYSLHNSSVSSPDLAAKLQGQSTSLAQGAVSSTRRRLESQQQQLLVASGLWLRKLAQKEAEETAPPAEDSTNSAAPAEEPAEAAQPEADSTASAEDLAQAAAAGGNSSDTAAAAEGTVSDSAVPAEGDGSDGNDATPGDAAAAGEPHQTVQHEQAFANCQNAEGHSELQLRLSSHECETGPDPRHTICTFHNIYLWHGTIYYLAAAAPNPPIPPIHISIYSNNTVQVETVLVSETGLSLADACKWQLAETERVPEAVLVEMTNPWNHHHAMAEFAPTLHAIACKYLGRCTYDRIDGFRPLLLDRWGQVRKVPTYQAFQGAMKCFSPSPSTVHLQHDTMFDKVVLVEKGVVGVGPRCRAHRYCSKKYADYGREPVEAQYMVSYRRRLADCLGLPQAASKEPINIVLVDRHFRSGRHFLNVNELRNMLSSQYPEPAYNVQLAYLEDMSFEQQAQLYATASILIQMHGASMGNWPMMAHDSVVVHVAHQQNATQNWAIDLIADMGAYGVTMVPISNEDHRKLHIDVAKLLASDTFATLNTEQQLEVITKHSCPKRVFLDCYWKWTNLMNLYLDVDILQAAMEVAMRDFTTKPASGV